MRYAFLSINCYRGATIAPDGRLSQPTSNQKSVSSSQQLRPCGVGSVDPIPELEITCSGDPATEGSNPSLSAISVGCKNKLRGPESVAATISGLFASTSFPSRRSTPPGARFLSHRP